MLPVKFSRVLTVCQKQPSATSPLLSLFTSCHSTTKVCYFVVVWKTWSKHLSAAHSSSLRFVYKLSVSVWVCVCLCACYFEAQRNRCLERNRKCYKCSLALQNFIMMIDHKQLTGCQTAKLPSCLTVRWRGGMATWRHGGVAVWQHATACGCHGWTQLHALSFTAWLFHSIFVVKWLQQSRRSLIMAQKLRKSLTHTSKTKTKTKAKTKKV